MKTSPSAARCLQASSGIIPIPPSLGTEPGVAQNRRPRGCFLGNEVRGGPREEPPPTTIRLASNCDPRLKRTTMKTHTELPSPIRRLVLIDELPLYRRGVAELLQRQGDMKVCGEFSDRQGALGAMDSFDADLVVMELFRADGAGVDLIKDLRLRLPRQRILILSQYPETLHAERVLQAGASGFVSKFEDDGVILEAIRGVLEGKTYFSAKVSAQLALRYLGIGAMESSSPIQGLTNRELQVFQLIGAGKPTRGIAAALGLSVKTIETYLEHLKRTLGVSSGTALTHRAVQWVERGMAD
jgi:DNA-binding NarL/FixJ family response regulator